MGQEEQFSGFPEECLEFLANLELNNNRKWFKDHREEYDQFVVSPAQEFIASLGELLASEIDGIVYDTSPGGRGSLMRIYRDVRFSRDKTPYHTSMRMVFWHEDGHRTNGAGFYMGFGPRTGGFYAGQYGFDRSTLSAYRKDIDRDSRGKNLESIIDQVEEKGYQVGGETYKRVPRGFDPDHPRARLLRHSGLYAKLEGVDSGMLLGPDAVNISCKHFMEMSPVVLWLLDMIGGSG